MMTIVVKAPPAPTPPEPSSEFVHRSSLYVSHWPELRETPSIGDEAIQEALANDRRRPLGMARFKDVLPTARQDNKFSQVIQQPTGQKRDRRPFGVAFRTDKLKIFFNYIDKDQSGKVTGSELIRALSENPHLLKMFSRVVSDDEALSHRRIGDDDWSWRHFVYWIRGVLHELDTDRSGTLEWPEFLALFSKAKMHLPGEGEEIPHVECRSDSNSLRAKRNDERNDERNEDSRHNNKGGNNNNARRRSVVIDFKGSGRQSMLEARRDEGIAKLIAEQMWRNGR